MQKTGGDISHLYAENTLVLESSHKPNHWELFQQAQLSDRSLWFILQKKKILDENGVEVALPSICKPGDVTHVVISRETERFVIEIHTHEAKTRSSRELLENLQESTESMSYKQGEVTASHKETWVAPSTKETLAGIVNLVPNEASMYTRKSISRNEKKWITIHSNPKRGSDLAIFVSQIVTTILRPFDQDERESDGSRHWEAIQSVLLRKFERDGVQDFHDELWSQKIFEGSSKKRTEYCNNKDGFLFFFTSDSGAFWRYSNRTRIDGPCKNSTKLEEIHIPQRTFMEPSVHTGKSTDSRRKGERQSPSSSLSNTNESFWR